MVSYHVSWFFLFFNLFIFGCAGSSLLGSPSLVLESGSYSLVTACRLLVAVASLVAECRLLATLASAGTAHGLLGHSTGSVALNLSDGLAVLTIWQKKKKKKYLYSNKISNNHVSSIHCMCGLYIKKVLLLLAKEYCF